MLRPKKTARRKSRRRAQPQREKLAAAQSIGLMGIRSPESDGVPTPDPRLVNPPKWMRDRVIELKRILYSERDFDDRFRASAKTRASWHLGQLSPELSSGYSPLESVITEMTASDLK